MLDFDWAKALRLAGWLHAAEEIDRLRDKNRRNAGCLANVAAALDDAGESEADPGYYGQSFRAITVQRDAARAEVERLTGELAEARQADLSILNTLMEVASLVGVLPGERLDTAPALARKLLDDLATTREQLSDACKRIVSLESGRDAARGDREYYRKEVERLTAKVAALREAVERVVNDEGPWRDAEHRIATILAALTPASEPALFDDAPFYTVDKPVSEPAKPAQVITPPTHADTKIRDIYLPGRNGGNSPTKPAPDWCMACDGSGADDTEGGDCPACEGMGEVLKPAKPAASESGSKNPTAGG